MGEGNGMHDARHGSEDSGYFSKRNSKAASTGGAKRDSMLVEEPIETVEEVEREADDDNDEEAEEADDEGASLEDPEEDEDEDEFESKSDGKKRENLTGIHDRDQAMIKASIAQPTTQSLTPDHLHQSHPQTQIGTRFISPRRPAEPRISADEAEVARGGYSGAL